MCDSKLSLVFVLVTCLVWVIQVVYLKHKECPISSIQKSIAKDAHNYVGTVLLSF